MLDTAIYRLALGAYALAIRLAARFKPKARLFVDGRKDVLPRMQAALAQEGRPRIWMHCASLGEFEQGRPVLEALRQQYPGHAIVLTFFSPSGYEVRKHYDGADYICYLPLDSEANASAFLDTVKPALCIFVKYEFWYYYLSAMQARHIPCLLISAIFRKEQGFFRWYGTLQRRMLRSFSHIFVQNGESLQLLAGIGITNASICGDTRFDRVVAAAASASATLPLADEFCNRHKILIAGSTWADDESLLQKALPLLPADWKLILVPHEVHDSHIHAIMQQFGAGISRWSGGTIQPGSRVLLVDKVGLLLQLYRYGTAAWIGGGFGRAGVHNVLEAAVYGLPCYHGPIYHQFIEARELISQGGASAIARPGELAAAIASLSSPDEYATRSAIARNYVLAHCGATRIILGYVAAMQW